MEIFFTILIMTLVVSLSGVAARILPFQIPLPLVQILAGALLAWPTFGLHVDFDPELFLVLFIPPLLFADGWKTPISEFLHHGREIIGLALVLVLITVVGIGYLIYWMVPGIPLIPAFALAAVLSPTDAVALSGIVGEGRIPKKIMSIVQGEALMNDASGLVSLKFAVAVAMGTMVFTWGGASIEFLKVAIGGLIAGVAVCWLYGKSLRLLSRQAPLAMRLRANSVWQMLEFVFNGMVFLMLGLQLPDIIGTSIDAANADPNVELWMLFTDIILVYGALMVVRFGWLWIMQRLSKRVLKKKPMEFANYSLRELLIASFAGVRGAITLAGVLSIPLFLTNGQPFPARYELVFIATGVILFSLLVGVVVLPLLLRGVDGIDKAGHRRELQNARAVMASVAIESLHKMEARLENDTEENIDPELLKEVSLRVIGNLRRRADGKSDLEQALFAENLERRFRLTALRAERAEVYHLRATQQISSESMQRLLRDLDLLEALLIEKEE
ncbi:MAG: Na+/H+ antiporter [Pantoea sp.]|nr:Na+/H+ antiporter [Pantoea sp.]